jgi:DNA-directed RNA polymerase subunit RPC12/RpoP
MKSLKTEYTCLECKNTVEVAEGANKPECCSKPMHKLELDPCENNLHAEMARNSVIEDACDDGRGQQ